MIVFSKNTLIIFVLLISLSLKSQTLDSLNFVNKKENYIRFFDDKANLNTFYKKLDTLLVAKKGKVRILQMGGSHIQAEIWPDQMRKYFLQLSPNINGGRGFVFPFKMAHTWSSKNHQISYTGTWKSYKSSIKKQQSKWGLSGITIETTDSISSFQIGYRSDRLTNYKFNRIKIFHDVDSTSFSLKLLSDTPLQVIENKTIGYTEFVLNTAQDTLSIEIQKTNKNQTHFRLYGLSLESDNPGVVYTSAGVNGAKTSSFLRNELLSRQLEVVNPDLVIFCIGINDAYYSDFCSACFEENYDVLVAKMKAVNPDVDIIFVTNNDSFYKRKYPNKRGVVARDVILKLAKKHQSGLWDLFEIMGGLGAVQMWENRGYAKADKLHFTDKGYRLIGNLMFEALMNDYQKHKIKK